MGSRKFVIKYEIVSKNKFTTNVNSENCAMCKGYVQKRGGFGLNV